MTWLLLWGARFLEPGRVSLLLLLEVAVAAISAALLAGEPFGPREALGCFLIPAAGALEGAAALARPLAATRPCRRERRIPTRASIDNDPGGRVCWASPAAQALGEGRFPCYAPAPCCT